MGVNPVRKYFRNFFIFSQEDRGFSAKGQGSGFVRTETRDGKGSFFVQLQNMKDSSDVLQYRVYLLKCGEREVLDVEMGTVNVRGNRGELRAGFDPDNVMGSGIAIEEFNGALVKADSGGGVPSYPLVALKDRKIDWRRFNVPVQKAAEAGSGFATADSKREDDISDILKQGDFVSKYDGGLESRYVKSGGESKPGIAGAAAGTGPKGAAKAAVKDCKPALSTENVAGYVQTEPASCVKAAEIPQLSQQDEFKLAEKEKSGTDRQDEPEPGIREKTVSALQDKTGPALQEVFDAMQKEEGQLPAQQEKEKHGPGNETQAESGSETESADRENAVKTESGKETESRVKTGSGAETGSAKETVSIKTETGSEMESSREKEGETDTRGECPPEPDETAESRFKHRPAPFFPPEQPAAPAHESIDPQFYRCPYLQNNVCVVQKAGYAGSSMSCAGCTAPRAAGKADSAERTVDLEALSRDFDKYFVKDNPFGNRKGNYRWWKVHSPVHLNNILHRHNIRTSFLYNPLVMTAHFKYRHLIIGIYSDRAKQKEYIVGGVPGVYGTDERPFAGIGRWVQPEGHDSKYGAFGYWLIYIDPRSGKVVRVN